MLFYLPIWKITFTNVLIAITSVALRALDFLITLSNKINNITKYGINIELSNSLTLSALLRVYLGFSNMGNLSFLVKLNLKEKFSKSFNL